MPFTGHSPAGGGRLCPPSDGFTIVELVVVLAVVVVVSSMGIPELNRFLQDNRLSSATNRFVMGLQYARAEAVKRNARVVMCASADGATCGGEWRDGWIVRVLPAGPVLDREGPMREGVAFPGEPPTVVTFAGDGAQPVPAVNLNIRLASSRVAVAYRDVDVGISGVITSCKEPCE